MMAYDRSEPTPLPERLSHLRQLEAESMFHRRTNASKLALLSCVHVLEELGVTLIDVQFLTEHLASLGAREISRSEYLRRLAVARQQPTDISDLASRDPLVTLRRRIDPSV